MFGSNARFDALPTICSYEHALSVYTDTKPIRGTTKRPLGARKHHAIFTIEKDSQEIAFVLYRTAVVRVRDDDTFLLSTGGYDTQMTTKFLRAIAPFGPFYMFNGYLTLRVGEQQFHVPSSMNNPLRVKDGVVLNPPQYYSWKINRKKANAVRKPYQSFLHFAKGYLNMLKDSDERVLIQFDEQTCELLQQYSGRALTRAVVDAKPEDYAQYLKAMLNPGWRTPEEALKAINWEITRAHSEEVLERVTLPIGTLPKADPYAMWVKPDLPTT